MTGNFTKLLGISTEERERARIKSEQEEAERAKRLAHWERWFRRVESWADGKDPAELAEYLSLATMMLLEARRGRRYFARHAELVTTEARITKMERDAYWQAVEELAPRVRANRDSRSLGGNNRAAKYRAKRLAVWTAWETLSRKGRGTKERFKTDQARHHGVSPRTIENWINQGRPEP